MSETAVAAPVPAVASPAPVPAAEAAVAAPESQLTLTIDGKDEVLDLSNPEHREALRRDAQKGRAADKRFSEADQARKEAQAERARMTEFLTAVKADPRAFFSDPRIGVDVKEFAQAVLAEELQTAIQAEEEAANPALKKQRQMESRLKAYEKQEAEAKAAEERAAKAKEAEAQKALVASHADVLGKLIVEALDSMGYVAGSSDDVRPAALEMANILETAAERGIALTGEQLATEFRYQQRAKLSQMAKAGGKLSDLLDPAQLQALLKEERKREVAELKTKHPMSGGKAVVGQKTGAQEDRKPGRSSDAIRRDLMLGRF